MKYMTVVVLLVTVAVSLTSACGPNYGLTALHPRFPMFKYCEHQDCKLIRKPVCGSDGKTYGNICLFTCLNKDRPELIVSHDGPCASGVQSEPISAIPMADPQKLVTTEAE